MLSYGSIYDYNYYYDGVVLSNPLNDSMEKTMALLNKAKKSLTSILATFQRADKELEQWEEVTKEEQKQIEARLETNRNEMAAAKKAREALKAFVNL